MVGWGERISLIVFFSRPFARNRAFAEEKLFPQEIKPEVYWLAGDAIAAQDSYGDSKSSVKRPNRSLSFLTSQ